MDSAQIEELGAKFKLAKSKTLNFAFAAGLGRKEDACALHKVKQADKLRREVKREAGSNKTICGLAEVAGQTLNLKCEEIPKKSVARQLRDFLRANGLLRRVQVFDMQGTLLIDDESLDGAEVDETGTDDDTTGLEDADDTSGSGRPQDTAQPDSPAAPALDSSTLEELKQKYKVLVRQVKVLLDQQPDQKVAFTNALSTIGKLLKKEDVHKARDGMVKLSEALKKNAAASKPDRVGNDGISASVKKLIALRKDIEADFSNLLKELSKYPDARIRQIGDEGHQKVFGGPGGLLDGLDTDLFAAVATWNKATGDERRKAALEVKRLTEKLTEHLADNDIVRLIENNPFGVSLQITMPLNAALHDIGGQISS